MMILKNYYKGIIWILFFFVLAGQIQANSSGEPLSPPVDINFTVENIPGIGKEVILKVKVTPLKDMHAEISCLLPEGIEPVREEGFMILSVMERDFLNGPQQTSYFEEIGLWVGPLKANITKEFTFRVKIPDEKKYELIAVVEALAKWGIKEERLIIEAGKGE